MDRFNTEYHSQLYLKYRINTPDVIVEPILNFLKENYKPVDNSINESPKWTLAVDVGCGSGQSTRVWSKYFEKIIGFDVSQTQIEEAKRNEENSSNIEFFVSGAESLPIKDNSVDLVIVSQAIHWFDQPRFFAEAKRILVPNGVLAIYRYDRIEPIWNGTVMSSVYDMRDEHPLIKDHMPAQVRYAQEQKLLDLVIPFPTDHRRRRDDIINKIDAPIGFFIGHMKSRSAYEKLREFNEEHAGIYMKDILKEIGKYCGVDNDDAAEEFSKIKIIMEYHYSLEMARKPNV